MATPSSTRLVAVESAALELQNWFTSLEPAPSALSPSVLSPSDPAPGVSAPAPNAANPSAAATVSPRPVALGTLTSVAPGSPPVVIAPSAVASPPLPRISPLGRVWGWLAPVWPVGLTLGCGLASLAGGMAWAEYRPLGTIPAATQVPVLEQGFRAVSAGWNALKGGSLEGIDRNPDRTGTLAANLEETDRQQLQQDLAQLQQEAHQLLDEVVALEQRLGVEPRGGSLDLRLESLQQILNPDLDRDRSTATLRVTLPSDALFGDGQAQLRPEAYRLLSTVISDLRRYPVAQVTIATHTDDIGDEAANRSLSFRQSRSLSQYLEDRLGSSYHWNPLGYGEAQALVDNSTNSNRQRNRRIEIEIKP
ncbi:OmpA family protein [Prochlorothrix hollandica]|uniref:OmpA family protein n=1 Tax=Prochlorothrix hollandica TaxID=1223 RepID=UPI003342BA59